jgi:hypothetical protein
LLLPPFDEYLLGYRDRGAVLDNSFLKRVNAGGGMMKPTVVVGGRVVGTWAQKRTKGHIAVTVDSFYKLSDSERRLLRRAAERYGEFNLCEVELLG